VRESEFANVVKYVVWPVVAPNVVIRQIHTVLGHWCALVSIRSKRPDSMDLGGTPPIQFDHKAIGCDWDLRGIVVGRISAP